MIELTPSPWDSGSWIESTPSPWESGSRIDKYGEGEMSQSVVFVYFISFFFTLTISS